METRASYFGRMSRILIPVIAAAISSGVTWALLRNGGKPAAEPVPAAPAKVQQADDAKVRALTLEVEKLRAELAEKSKSATQPAAGITPEDAAAAAARDAEALKEKQQEAMEAKLAEKMQRLTEKLSLAPEQAKPVEAWHRSHMQALLAASLKSPRDPADYHLRVAYRQDLPPEVQATLGADQVPVWQKYDQDARADSVESITNGELGYIEETLDLSRDQKDQLFPHLSQLYLEDTEKDFLNVVDLDTLSAQKDEDNARRRAFYSTIFTPKQMEKWEAIAADYKTGMMKSFGAEQ